MTQKYVIWLLMLIILSSCATPNKRQPQMRSIDLFKTYITGDFNNDRQIHDQIKSGLQTHPRATHVNRVCDAIITNRPQVDGFWILEESYYIKPGSIATEIKPYLFLFEAGDNNTVKLTPFNIPTSYDPKEVRNDNPNLQFNYYELVPSATFKPAFYQREGDAFKINAPNELPNGMKFTLIETIKKDQLIVMELLEKNGERITPYDTPIIYDRVPMKK